MKVEIPAGESFTAQCPGPERAIVKVGEKLPDSDKAVVRVLAIKGNVVTLGPMKVGELHFNLPCETTNLEVQASIKPLSPELAQKRFEPLAAEKVGYPLSLFLVIVGILCTFIAAALVAWFRRRKTVSAPVRLKAKRNRRAELEQSLGFLEVNVPQPEAHHFQELYKSVRRFLETELKLKTRALTTGEFLGTFRALALRQSANQNLVSELEFVLRTADDVRFAGKSVASIAWPEYLQRIRAIVAAFPPVTADRQGGSQKK